MRDDAEGHELAGGGERGGRGRSLVKRVDISHHMIGGRHHQNRVGLEAQRLKSRQRNRRGGVAADRLEQDGARGQPCGPQLLGHREAVSLVAHDDGGAGALDAGEARSRFLQHGLPAGERQQLFRIQLPRQRPQACARAAGQDHGYQRRFHGLIQTACRGRSHNS